MNTIKGFLIGVVLEVLLAVVSFVWIIIRPYGGDDGMLVFGTLFLSVAGWWILPSIGATIGFIIDVLGMIL